MGFLFEALGLIPWVNIGGRVERVKPDFMQSTAVNLKFKHKVIFKLLSCNPPIVVCLDFYQFFETIIKSIEQKHKFIIKRLHCILLSQCYSLFIFTPNHFNISW